MLDYGSRHDEDGNNDVNNDGNDIKDDVMVVGEWL